MDASICVARLDYLRCFCLGACACTPVVAQGPANDYLFKRGQGLILDTEDDLANIPRAPDYRAFLPDRVDLSDMIGFQRHVIKVIRTLASAGRSHTLARTTPTGLRTAI
jgi:hypothetical protein